MHRKPEPPEHLSDLTAAGDWPALEALLLDIDFLESRVAEGRVHELAADLREAWQAMPADRPARRMIRLIHEALLAEIHFIHEVREHCPHALFQCLWNRGWWYDHPDAAPFFDEPAGGWPDGAPPWDAPGEKLHALLERWRAHKEHQTPGFVWVRSLGPPAYPLGSPLAGTLCGHTEAVRSLAFSPDRVHLASRDDDETTRLWDLRTMREVVAQSCGRPDQVVPGIPFSGHGRSIRVRPKGQTLLDTPIGVDAVDTFDPFEVDWVTVSVRDASTGTELWQREMDPEAANTVCLSPDGATVACSARDQILLLDAATGLNLKTLVGRPGELAMSGLMAFSPDGRWIAALNHRIFPSGEIPPGFDIRSRVLFIWDVESGVLRQVLPGAQSDMWRDLSGMAFSPDGTILAVAHRDKPLQLWNVENGSPLAQLAVIARAVAFSPDGRLLASASEKTIQLWDMEGPCSAIFPRGNREPVRQWDLSVDASRVATTDDSGDLILWDTSTGMRMLRVHTPDDSASAVRISPDGNRVAVGLDSGLIQIHDAHTGQQVVEIDALVNDTMMFSALAYSPDSQLLASSGLDDHTVGIWDAHTGDLVARLEGHMGYVHELEFSADARHIVTVSLDHTCRLWETRTGKELRHFHPFADSEAWLPPRPQRSLKVTLAGHDKPTRFLRTHDWTVVAWYGLPLKNLEPHPDSRTWTGYHDANLVRLRVEGNIGQATGPHEPPDDCPGCYCKLPYPTEP